MPQAYEPGAGGAAPYVPPLPDELMFGKTPGGGIAYPPSTDPVTGGYVDPHLGQLTGATPSGGLIDPTLIPGSQFQPPPTTQPGGGETTTTTTTGLTTQPGIEPSIPELPGDGGGGGPPPPPPPPPPPELPTTPASLMAPGEGDIVGQGASNMGGGSNVSNPMGLSGSRPAWATAFRGLQRSPFAKWAGIAGQQPLGAPGIGGGFGTDPLEQERLRQLALMGISPDSAPPAGI